MALHWKVIIGMAIGVLYAWCSIMFDWNAFTLEYIQPFGDIFINILKMIAVPLVLFSIISGVASLGDVKKLGRMGIKTLGIYLATTMIAVVVGLIVVNAYQPGTRINSDVRIENRIKYELWRDANGIQKLDDICLSCDPANADIVQKVKTQGEGMQSDWVQDKLNKRENARDDKMLQPLVDVVPNNIFQSMSNGAMLQIIFFAIFFGIVLVSIPKDKSEPVMKLVDGLNEVFVFMVSLIMRAMPFFVFALMAGQIVKSAGSDPEKFAELLWFFLKYGSTVLVGLLFMIFLFYPALVSTVVKKVKYLYFMRGMRDAQITAFSTSSSVATLPVTMDCVHNNIGVSERTSSFVLPIGATVNMDGTSLYQAVAVVALAQFHMVDLSIAQQITIVVTATLASIGAAAIPSAGLVLMIIVLESVGLNPAWIALIFPIDRILDMCRTVVNVTGDGAVSTIIANGEGELEIS